MIDEHAKVAEALRRYLSGINALVAGELSGYDQTSSKRKMIELTADLAESEYVNGGVGAKTMSEIWESREVWKAALKSYRQRRRIAA